MFGDEGFIRRMFYVVQKTFQCYFSAAVRTWGGWIRKSLPWIRGSHDLALSYILHIDINHTVLYLRETAARFCSVLYSYILVLLYGSD